MPYLDDEDIRRLTGMKDSAEYELDLCGLDLAHSIASVERMIERSRFRKPRTVVIKIDPATATSGETFFKPIGRLLILAMKAGKVQQCRPHMEAGSGYWVSLRGNLNVKKS
jgi:hypothetical protein